MFPVAERYIGCPDCKLNTKECDQLNEEAGPEHERRGESRTSNHSRGMPAIVSAVRT